MKRRFLMIGLIGIFGLLVLGGPSCTVRYPGERIDSPDGQHTAWAEVNQSKADMRKYLCVKLKITDESGKNESGKIEFEEQTGASVTMNWSISWIANNELILRSSDIGNQAWLRDAEGHWNPAPADSLRP